MSFFKLQISFPLNFASYYNYIIPLKLCSWNIVCFGQKEPVNVQFFKLLSAVMKFHPILHAIWVLSVRMKIHQILHVKLESETTSQFFFKLCITFQCHERQLFCIFLAETLYDLCKRSLSKSKMSDFWLLR